MMRRIGKAFLIFVGICTGTALFGYFSFVWIALLHGLDVLLGHDLAAAIVGGVCLAVVILVFGSLAWGIAGISKEESK